MASEPAAPLVDDRVVAHQGLDRQDSMDLIGRSDGVLARGSH